MRLFYALMPSEQLILSLKGMMEGVAGARWQSAEQLHLTLRFIGEAPARSLDDLADALPAGGLSLPPLHLSGVGSFEKKGRANALWVRVAPREPLAVLHRKLDRACQMTGLAPEGRAYLPHITIARLGAAAGAIDGWLKGYAGISPVPALFDRCSLLESSRTDSGSHYEEIASVPVRR